MPRLDLLLARCTGLGRRAATRAIRAGRLRAADGTPLADAKVRIPPSELPLPALLDDRPVVLREHVHLLQHKPAGVVTALRDARHPTAYDLLDGAPLHRHLRAVGRLDRDTTGLLLWTTDGTLLHRLAHPRYAVPRTYEAVLDRPPRPLPPDLVLDDGHRPTILELDPLEDERPHPALPRPDAGPAYRIVLVGGKFHEVKRIFAALGARVLALCRTRYGALELPYELDAGAWTEVECVRPAAAGPPLAALPATVGGRRSLRSAPFDPDATE